MHRPGQFLGQGGQHGALTLHPVQTLEGRRFDHHIEMAFPARTRARMALVASAVVLDLEPAGLEGGGQLVVDGYGDGAHRRRTFF